MEILGIDETEIYAHEDIKSSVSRKAWSILQCFGREESVGFFVEGLSCDVEEDERFSDSGVITTGYIYFGSDNQFRFCVDQFPMFEGKASTDMGYAVFHIEQLDIYKEVTHEQQLVFRQESHELGPAVLIGDNYELMEVTELADILDVNSGLDVLSQEAWKFSIADEESKLYSSPLL